MKKLLAPLFVVAASPAAAASKNPFSAEFYSLSNTDFIALIGFLIFIGILIYFKVPAMLGKMLDDRAEGIRADLEEARKLREEAQALLASYERKQKEVSEQAERIVAKARDEATAAAEAAKADIAKSVQRRLAAAEEQIASAEAAAKAEIQTRAVTVAVAAAREVVAKALTDADRDAMIDESISEVEARLH